MKPLRDYQQRAIESVLTVMAHGSRSPLLVAPTGSGKTRMAVEICSRALARGKKLVWVAHRKELLEQCQATLQAEGCDHTSIIRADDKRADPTAPIQICSIQTLVSRENLRPKADILVWDEAHHVKAAQWLAIAQHYKDAWRIGLTATPERADGSALGDVFDSLTVAAQYSDLIHAGHIVDCDLIAPVEEVRGSIAMLPVDAYKKYAPKSAAIVFAANLPCAREYLDGFGDRARVVAGETPKDEREVSIELFAAGNIDVLINCMVFTEGFDSPRASTCILARGCTHASTYMQIAGRVLRKYDGKSRALLIDLTGASLAHGMPTEDRVFSLEGKAIVRKAKSLWQCKTCGCVLPARPKACPRCGHVPPPPEVRPVRTVEMCSKTDSVTCAEKRAYYDDMLARAESRGFRPGWAAYKFKEKFGHWPRNARW